jgi:hypothetical protein
MSLTDYFEAAVNAMPGDPAGFTVSLLCVVTSQAVASATRRPFAQRGLTNPGWGFQTAGMNSALSFSLGGTNTANTPTSGIAAGDVGKIGLYTATWDGPGNSARLFAKRAQVGTGTGLTGGFSPDTAARPMFGRSDGGFASDGIAVLGVYFAVGIATLAQYQAQWDACMADERIQGCPGLPGVLIDLTQDVRGNGGALPSTLVDRGVGGVSFTRVGSPALFSQFARAWTA